MSASVPGLTLHLEIANGSGKRSHDRNTTLRKSTAADLTETQVAADHAHVATRGTSKKAASARSRQKTGKPKVDANGRRKLTHGNVVTRRVKNQVSVKAIEVARRVDLGSVTAPKTRIRTGPEKIADAGTLDPDPVAGQGGARIASAAVRDQSLSCARREEIDLAPQSFPLCASHGVPVPKALIGTCLVEDVIEVVAEGGIGRGTVITTAIGRRRTTIGIGTETGE